MNISKIIKIIKQKARSFFFFVIFVLSAQSTLNAETWICKSNNNIHNENLNEQNILFRVKNGFIKKSQFGDRKIKIAFENKEVIYLEDLKLEVFIKLNKIYLTYQQTMMNNSKALDKSKKLDCSINYF